MMDAATDTHSDVHRHILYQGKVYYAFFLTPVVEFSDCLLLSIHRQKSVSINYWRLLSLAHLMAVD